MHIRLKPHNRHSRLLLRSHSLVRPVDSAKAAALGRSSNRVTLRKETKMIRGSTKAWSAFRLSAIAICEFLS